MKLILNEAVWCNSKLINQIRVLEATTGDETAPEVIDEKTQTALDQGSLQRSILRSGKVSLPKDEQREKELYKSMSAIVSSLLGSVGQEFSVENLADISDIYPATNAYFRVAEVQGRVVLEIKSGFPEMETISIKKSTLESWASSSTNDWLADENTEAITFLFDFDFLLGVKNQLERKNYPVLPNPPRESRPKKSLVTSVNSTRGVFTNRP